MPNSINVPTPPMPSGDAENKIRQLHSYLFRLSEQLALILNSMESGSSQAPVSTAGGDIYAVRDQLKQLIVNTTATLRQEMAGITSNLMDAMDTLDDALRQEMAGIRSELLKTISATAEQLDTELRNLVSETDESLRQEIESGIAAVTAMIDALEDALEARLDDHDTAISALEAAISALDTDISDINTDLSGIKENISDVEKNVEDLSTSLQDTNDAISNIKLGSLGVRCGTAMCTNALAGGQHEDISVSFDALPAVPVVVASLIGTGTDGEYGGNVSCQVLTNSITKNSFLVRVACSTGQTTAYSYGVSWIAIAEGEQDGNTD